MHISHPHFSNRFLLLWFTVGNETPLHTCKHGLVLQHEHPRTLQCFSLLRTTLVNWLPLQRNFFRVWHISCKIFTKIQQNFILEVNCRTGRSVVICPFFQRVCDCLLRYGFCSKCQNKLCLKEWQRLKFSSSHSRIISSFWHFYIISQGHFAGLNVLKSNSFCGYSFFQVWPPSKKEDVNLNTSKGILHTSFNI